MITLDRKQLAAELALLSSVIELKGTIPILAYVKVEVAEGTATLTASDVERALTVSLPAPGEDCAYCLPLKPLKAAVALFDGNEVQFTERPNERVEVKCNRSRHLFALRPVEQFPETSHLDGARLRLGASDLSVALERTARCVDTRSGSRWATQGVCFQVKNDTLHLISCEGTHLALVKMALSKGTDDLEFVLPRMAIEPLRLLLDGAETVTMVYGKTVRFETPVRALDCRLLDGQFMQWEMVIPKNTIHEIALPPETTDALRRCCVTASAATLVRKPLSLSFYQDRLDIESYTGDEVSFETLPIECPTFNGEPLVVKANGDQIIGYLRTAKNPVLKIKDARTQMLFEDKGDENYLYVTMPLSPDK